MSIFCFFSKNQCHVFTPFALFKTQTMGTKITSTHRSLEWRPGLRDRPAQGS